jgi:hypothetical protein
MQDHPEEERGEDQEKNGSIVTKLIDTIQS